MRTAFWVLLAFLTLQLSLVVLWLTIPSERIMLPISWEYDGESERVTLTRVVNWPTPVTARWETSIYSPDGQDCTDDGRALYEPYTVSRKEKTTSVYRISLELRPCIAVPDSVVIVRWSVLAFGFIPLRPAYLAIPPEAREGFF